MFEWSDARFLMASGRLQIVQLHSIRSKSLIIEGSFCSRILTETPTFSTAIQVEEFERPLASFVSCCGRCRAVRSVLLSGCPNGVGCKILLVVVHRLAYPRELACQCPWQCSSCISRLDSGNQGV